MAFHMLATYTWGQFLLSSIMIGICLLLMLIILLQKGRGEGLAGAFGGAGGSSAFGAKTGDVFTWITVVLATVFILLSVVTNFVFDESAAAASNVATITTDEESTPPSEDGVPVTAPAPTPAGDTPTSDTGDSADAGAGDVKASTKDSGAPADNTPSDEAPADESPKTDGKESLPNP